MRMDLSKFFKILSWHEIRNEISFTSRANIDFTVLYAFCGKKLEVRSEHYWDSVSTGFNFNDKTCESCLRISVYKPL